MTRFRVVLQPTKPTSKLEIDTVEITPSNRILLAPDSIFGGDPINFTMRINSNPYTISGNDFKLIGQDQAIIDTAWGDTGTTTDVMTDDYVSLTYTYDNGTNDFNGSLTTDTSALYEIHCSSIPMLINLDQFFAFNNMITLYFYNILEISGNIEYLSTNLQTFDARLSDMSPMTGNLKNIPTSINRLTMWSNTNNKNVIGVFEEMTVNQYYTFVINNFDVVNGKLNAFTSCTNLLTFTLWDIGIIDGSLTDLPSTITNLQMNTPDLTGSIQNLPSSLIYCTLHNAINLTGSINTIPTSIVELTLYSCGNNIDGSLEYDWTTNGFAINSITINNMNGFSTLNVNNISNQITWFELTNSSVTIDYNSNKTWPNGMRTLSLVPTGSGLTQTEIDNLLYDLSNTTWAEPKSINLTGTNAIPSATGLTYVTSLEAQGCTVIVNT